MLQFILKSRRILHLSLVLAAGIFGARWCGAQSLTPALGTNEIRVVELQGKVEISPFGATTWVLTQTNQPLFTGDRLRTGPNSRVALRWADESVVPFGASTELEVLPPDAADAQPGLHLVRGVLSFFHRDKPGRIRVMTRGAVAGIEGTEFVLAVDDNDRTVVWVIDGKVRFGNAQATLVLTNGEQAVADVGQPPARTAGFIANNILQWSFYYPAVLDPADLALTDGEQSALAESLAAYRAGDLLAALAKYPAGRQPGSDAERVFYAALLLSVGDVEKTQNALSALTSTNVADVPARLATSLRKLIAAVKHESYTAPAPQLTTEFLAESYYQQSLGNRQTSLTAALLSARQAAAKSPEFGFAWERVAELEFSFGRSGAAGEALDKSIVFSPRNAQAAALKGFLLAAAGRNQEALASFERAIQLDSALGNAWLGRGLCRIHLGDNRGGREDLLIAAALEPQRSELRSYLGKAYGNTGDFMRASKELRLAEKLDPQDPTAFLYSAVLNQEHNRVNEAIRDLEKSEQLNDNRSVYRSQLLLDQDQAMRAANLAGMYQDAGMQEVAIREASRAVNYDYGNYSAHLFLANSFAQQMDSSLVNRRYETASESEFLLANLLAPVSAGPISPSISQQEYSSFFNQKQFGVVSDTEYLSRGAWSQSGEQYGAFDNFNYDFRGEYVSDPGQRPNNDLTIQNIILSVKTQLTPQDSAFFRIQYDKLSGGDLSQQYTPSQASPTLHFDERQEPMVYLGYHHEWAPGIHTLVMGARLVDHLSFTNLDAPAKILGRHLIKGTNVITAVDQIAMHEIFDGRLEIYSGEVQQIFQQPGHNTILGARAQYGHFNTGTLQDLSSDDRGLLSTNPYVADFSNLFKRFALYGYHQWEITDWLEVIGGASYDRIIFPADFRIAPISSREKTMDQISPKAGMIFRPAKDTVARFAYSRSISGASLDQSFSLEPSQLAGFVQSFRSLIPESVVGGTAGARFEAYGLSLEQKFATGTYVAISGQLLNSVVNQLDGIFVVDGTTDFAYPDVLRERLNFSEQSLLVTANQLIGKGWALGATYRLSQAVLHDDYPTVPIGGLFGHPPSFHPKTRLEGVMNNLDLFAIYNHRSGFFGETEALWYAQHNFGYGGTEPGDNFWQFNLFAGYRFPRRRAEVSLGLLNLTGQDYHINPLNVATELPHGRTLAARFTFHF